MEGERGWREVRERMEGGVRERMEGGEGEDGGR